MAGNTNVANTRRVVSDAIDNFLQELDDSFAIMVVKGGNDALQQPLPGRGEASLQDFMRRADDMRPYTQLCAAETLNLVSARDGANAAAVFPAPA
jgi:hypothetical protein